MQIESTENIDAAKIGKMFVTKVSFSWNEGGKPWNSKTNKYDEVPGHWSISAQLSDKPSQYGNTATMSLQVEQGIGQKLAEVLLPVIIADASKKAQQLADDSKEMLKALGDRTLACLADMPKEA